MTGTPVNVDNFVRAETDRMFAALAQQGGSNRLAHNRTPTPLDQQTVIRMNRDTLYSYAVLDITDGATLTVPESGDRYVSVMVVNQDHYINRIVHSAGVYDLSVDEFESPFVLVATRIFVDPADPEDVATVNALQDRFAVTSTGARPFAPSDYDPQSLDSTRSSLLDLAKNIGGFDRAFGCRGEVDPVRHLLGAAAGWGGLPEHEAYYVGGTPDLPVGEYTLRVVDVPVDGFWSISVYNAEGFFVAHDHDAVSINDVTAVRDADGSVTVRFGGPPDDRPNRLPIMDGWNYLVRLYRPHREVLDGTWTFPGATPVR
jgi:hypothetical protein